MFLHKNMLQSFFWRRDIETASRFGFDFYREVNFSVLQDGKDRGVLQIFLVKKCLSDWETLTISPALGCSLQILKQSLCINSGNSETLPIVHKQKRKSFAFPLPHSYILRLEQLFPSTIYIIGHGCCDVVGESAVCRYWMAFLWRHNFTTWTKPVQTNTPPHFSIDSTHGQVVQGVHPINLFEVSKPSVTRLEAPSTPSTIRLVISYLAISSADEA